MLKTCLATIMVTLLACSSVQAQGREARFQRNFEACMDNQTRGVRVTRSELRSIREECRHRAAARTERQARRVQRERPVYVPVRPVRPLERY
jgi:hypothetical protein